LKTAKIVLLSLVGLLALVFLLQIVASETGEVVVLSTAGDDGAEETTRLWVVDLDDGQYLRAQPESGWYSRLVAAPAVRLERDGKDAAYTAVTRADQAGVINGSMREKYGWRDVLIEVLVGGRDDAVAVQLVPAD
jgi:hypothetical protein